MTSIGVLGRTATLAASAACALIVVAARPASAADADAATAKERALMEHACRSVQAGLAREAYDRCLEAQLQSLRGAFGPDLARLSAPARAKIDAACSQAQTLRGREGYLDCLSAQLTALSAGSARPLAAARSAEAIAAELAQAPTAAAVAAESESSFPIAGVAAAVIAAVLVAGAVVFFRMKPRPAAHACRVCGVDVPGSADLCGACRRHAADAIRQATIQRADQQRDAEGGERRRQEEVEAQRLNAVQRDEEEQRRANEAARHAEEEAVRREEQARLAAEEQRRAGASMSPEADESAFDPYLALGLAAAASEDDVRAAYEEAKITYDPEQVAHLGYDAKQHFARKWRAIERAYQMLARTGSPA